jgi:Protein of unknown function (DUF3761)
MKWLSIARALGLCIVLGTNAQAYQCNGNHYVNSSGVEVHSPSCGQASEGHETAICHDGSHSYSMHRSGTCSRHGGVARWE